MKGQATTITSHVHSDAVANAEAVTDVLARSS